MVKNCKCRAWNGGLAHLPSLNRKRFQPFKALRFKNLCPSLAEYSKEIIESECRSNNPYQLFHLDLQRNSRYNSHLLCNKSPCSNQCIPYPYCLLCSKIYHHHIIPVTVQEYSNSTSCGLRILSNRSRTVRILRGLVQRPPQANHWRKTSKKRRAILRCSAKWIKGFVTIGEAFWK